MTLLESPNAYIVVESEPEVIVLTEFTQGPPGPPGEGSGIVSGVCHLSNLDLTDPHPLGDDLPANRKIIELIGQTDPDENGTYWTPSNPETGLLVRADSADQLIAEANIGKTVTFSLLWFDETQWIGSHEFIIGAHPVTADAILTIQQGTSMVVMAQTASDPTVGFDADGGIPSGVLVLSTNDDVGKDGLWIFNGDDVPLTPVAIFAGYGVRVLTMTSGDEWVNSPHGGWVNISATSSDNLGSFYGEKSSDQTWTSTATPTDVTGFEVSVGANQTWKFDYLFQVTGGAAGDARVALVGPSGSVARMIVTADLLTASTSTTVHRNMGTLDTIGTPVDFGALTTGVWVQVTGTVKTSSTAGVVKLQASQATPSVTTTRLLAGGYIHAVRVV